MWPIMLPAQKVKVMTQNSESNGQEVPPRQLEQDI